MLKLKNPNAEPTLKPLPEDRVTPTLSPIEEVRRIDRGWVSPNLGRGVKNYRTRPEKRKADKAKRKLRKRMRLEAIRQGGAA